MVSFDFVRFAKLLSPFMICLLLNILSLSPWGWDVVSHRSIPFVFGIIFYFAVFNPSVLSGWAVFVLGILTDLMMNAPFGIHGFIYSVLFFLIYFNRQLLSELPSVRLWQAFALITGFVLMIWYLMISVSMGFLQNLSSVFIPYVFIISTYPLFMRLAHGLDKWLRVSA